METVEEQSDEVVSDDKSECPDGKSGYPGDVDADLIARCKEELPHETAAYYELLKKYESMVYSTCYRMLGDKLEAEEATQDAFLRIFHKIHQFEGRSTFKTWMFRIVYNFCMTRRRKLATKREREETVGDEMIIRTKEEHRMAMGPDMDNSEYVHLALKELRDEDREIITLRFISDLSLEQIAEVLDAKLSATKMRLYRAMEKFKDVYLRQQKAREEMLNEA
ncbi:MAG: sigma-70 family RNA polymerase sigma factor [Verrucomicrobiales bacterium]|nr:sigma-70 family RNA polymerase sigma factor [Verrucomicrobiales bacterium]